MIESDGGVFRPLGFGFTGNEAARETVKAIATLLRGHRGRSDHARAAAAPTSARACRKAACPGMSLDVDGSKYFLIHHTPADTIDKIDPVEMAKCAAHVAVMAYVVADLPDRLGS